MRSWPGKVLGVLPVPFWVYFFSILAGHVGLLPHQSGAYDWIARHILPVAIILMLIGSPIAAMAALGKKAFAAMAIATGTIFIAQVAAYLLLLRFMPEDAWKSVGALMGTWIGGSANMVAIKEILQMPDSNLSALVVVDAIVSYGWMALLLAVAPAKAGAQAVSSSKGLDSGFRRNDGPAFAGAMKVLIVGFMVGEVCVGAGKIIGGRFSLLPVNGWTLLIASTAAVLLALTPLKRLQTWGASKVGTLLLYLVLVTIGAKTTLGSAGLQAPIFLVYGALSMLLHGIMALGLGKIFKIPLFLLSTASQANIGGAVSAPLVAEAYRPGTAHIGVLMAVLGAVIGTYLGVAGGFFCRAVGQWLH